MVRKCWGKDSSKPPEPLVKGLEVAGSTVAIPTAAFLSPPHPNLLCMVCHEVPSMPLRCKECEQPLCGGCSDRWFSGHGKTSCPGCRSAVGGVGSLKRGWGPGYGMVAHESKMMCPHSTSLCKVKGNLEKIKAHLEKGCPSEPIACGLGECTKYLMRRDIEAHRKRCKCRLVACGDCGVEVMRKYLTEHKEAECTSRIVECVMGCGHQDIREEDLPTHQSVCPMEITECVCGERVLRGELEGHMEATPGHLSLLMQSVIGLKASLAALQ